MECLKSICVGCCKCKTAENSNSGQELRNEGQPASQSSVSANISEGEVGSQQHPAEQLPPSSEGVTMRRPIRTVESPLDSAQHRRNIRNEAKRKATMTKANKKLQEEDAEPESVQNQNPAPTSSKKQQKHVTFPGEKSENEENGENGESF